MVLILENKNERRRAELQKMSLIVPVPYNYTRIQRLESVVSQISQRINNDEILISSNSNGVSTNAGKIAPNSQKLANLAVDSNNNLKLVNATATKSIFLTTTDSNNSANNVVTVTGDKKSGYQHSFSFCCVGRYGWCYS